MIVSSHQPTAAALATLIILQSTMLAALYTKTVPHPPELVAPFAIAPFLGTSLSVAVCALVFGGSLTVTGRIMGCLAALCALVSYGPHKYFDPAFAMIWPAVITGQVAIAVLLVNAVRNRLRDSDRAQA